jgi:hypothetical protein
MRVPIRHLAGHLLWSRHGTVWAVYRVHDAPDEAGLSSESVQGSYVTDQVRDELLSRVTQLVRSLVVTQSPRLFGLCAQVDAGEIALRMLDGVELPLDDRGHPWVDCVDGALNLLNGQEMHRRTLWLAVPLASQSSRMARSAAFSAVGSELSALLGLRQVPVSRAEVSSYRQQAARIEAEIGGGTPLRPATPAEIVWMVQHALHRGLAEPLLGQAESSRTYGSRLVAGRLASPSYADLGLARIHEGGQERDSPDRADDPASEGEAGIQGGRRRKRAVLSALRRRWLQVECEDGIGYQAHLALAECPPAVNADSADVLAQLELLDFPVDFVVDLQLVPADKARQQIQRKKNELVDQADQYDARPTGMPHTLTQAAGDLSEMDARLSQTSVEVEVQSITALCVWGPTPQVCDARARALGAALASADYRAVRPAGLQESLFEFGLPGSLRGSLLREFVQHQLSEDWAASGALTRSEVGDPTGILLGIDLEVGTTRPVLVNIADAPKKNASASVGIVGDLGAGKSVFQKLLTAGVVDRGGRAIVIDRTPVREWAHFARAAAAGRHQIIDASASELSIDPLRLIGGATGAHYALSYLTLQLGVGPMTVSGAVLHNAVERTLTRAEPSMHHVLGALREMAADRKGSRRDTAASLADLLGIVASNELARMVFDSTLPTARLDDARADMVVVTTAGLTLPPKEAFARPEALQQQPLEALIGRAMLYLIAAVARQTAFEDPGRFCAIVMDECYWLTSSAEGTALVHEVLHDGRKHGAGLIAGAHDEKELGPDRGLMAYRAVARTASRERAGRALEFIGQDSKSDDMLRLVTTGLAPVGQRGREGEILLCGPRMNTGRVKVIIPPVARIAQAISTRPGDLGSLSASPPSGTLDPPMEVPDVSGAQTPAGSGDPAAHGARSTAAASRGHR